MDNKLQIAFNIKKAYKNWTQASVNRKIFGAAFTVGVMTLLVKFVAFGKELLVAATFGTNDALDAFFIALVLPSLLLNVLAGSIEPAFIPTYIQVGKEGKQITQQLISSVLFFALIILVLASCLLYLALPYLLPLIGSGFSPEKQALTYALSHLLLCIPVVGGLSVFFASILRAEEQFALSSISSIFISFGTIGVLLLAGGQWGIYALVIGLISGYFLEAGILAWKLKQKGFSLLPRWYGFSPAMKQVMKQYLPMIAGALLMSSTTAVDQSMATMVGPGSVAALNYGNKIISLFLGLGVVPLSSAVIPYFSRMVADDDWKGLLNTLKKYTLLTFVVSLPIVGVLVAFSEPVVTTIYQRGAFTQEDTHLVAEVQAMYAFQIPFYFMAILAVRVLSASKLSHFLFFVSISNLLLNVSLNYIFIYFLGLKGIALSTSSVYFFSWFVLTMLTYWSISKNISSDTEKKG